MQLLHVSEGATQEGSIDDVFQLIVKSCFEWQPTLDLLKSLRHNIEGPTAWAWEGHRKLFLYPYDKGTEQVDTWAQVQVLAFATECSVSYTLPENECRLPWSPRFYCHPRKLVQATIAVAHALNVTFAMVNASSAKHEIINDNPVVQARTGRVNDEVMCPHCETLFTLSDATEWDHQRHLLCRQRLQIV